MEEKVPIPVLDNMPDNVKQIVDYLNKNNISFDDYSGNDDDDDEIELDTSFYDGSYIENDESGSEDDSNNVDVEENANDAESLSDLNNMF